MQAMSTDRRESVETRWDRDRQELLEQIAAAREEIKRLGVMNDNAWDVVKKHREREQTLTEALAKIERMAGAASYGETPAMPIAAIAGAGENPKYGPGNPDWEHDREKEGP